MKLRLLLTLFGATFLGVLSLHAQFTWTGAGGDDDPANAANWLSTGAPVPVGNGTEDFTFGDSPRSQPNLPNDFSVHNVTITSTTTGYFWGDPGSSSNLTLTGDVTSVSASHPFFVFNQNFLTLAPGPHTIAAGDSETGGDIYVFGSLAGSGNILKTGVKALFVVSPDDASTFTGNIDLERGDLSVAGDGSLGTGTITMNGGRLNVAHYESDHTVTLYNNLLFSNNDASFSGDDGLPALLTITGSGVAMTGVPDVHIYADSFVSLTISGGLGETDPGTNFFFGGNGRFIINGDATYTGTTAVADGTTLILGAAAPPTAGSMVTYGTGYIGSEVLTNLQTNFIDLFDKPNTTGVIGFDSPDPDDPQTFTEAIDLTNFNVAARLGTSGAAILSGPITPQGDIYQFGGVGVLAVNSALTDVNVSEPRNVVATDGLQLVLGGNNDYTGGTFADSGASIIFNQSFSLPATGWLSASSSGYIGYSDNAGIAVSDFLMKFDTSAMHGVLGFDSADIGNPIKITEDINLSGFDANVFIGTATAAKLGCEIVITPAGSAYRFTGFRNGQLTVESHLTGGYGVVIGLDQADIVGGVPFGASFKPSVTLTGDNDYSSGTLLQSGRLIVGQTNGEVGTDATTALGTGTLTIANVSGSTAQLESDTTGIIIPNDLDLGASNVGFALGGDNDFTLSGNLTSASGRIDKVDRNTVTISHDNLGLSSNFNLRDGGIIFASDLAAGTGLLGFSTNRDDGEPFAEFSSPAPVVQGLDGGYIYNGDGPHGSSISLDLGTQLTINQTSSNTYSGTIYGSYYDEFTTDHGIVKTGAGTLTLSGTGEYSGDTIVNQGTLIASGENNFSHQLGYGAVTINGGALVLQNTDLSNTSFTVNSGGTLGGIGSTMPGVTVNSGGTITPGLVGSSTPTGTLAVGGLTLTAGGIYQWNLQNPTAYSQITVGSNSAFTLDGSVTTGTPFIIKLTSFDGSGAAGTATGFLNQPYTWKIFDVDVSSSIAGYSDPNQFSLDGSQFTTNIGNGSFSIAQVGNEFDLTFTPVPEPSTYALFGLGLGAVLFPALRRRKRV